MSKIKIILSALAVVVGIGGAFASKLDEPVTFYQTSTDTYTKLSNPIGNCQKATEHSCKIEYANDPQVSTFTWSNRPPGGVESSTTMLFQ